jgi:serine protease AprX
MAAEVISERLRAALAPERAANAPQSPELIPVVIEIALDRAKPHPYEDLDARYQDVCRRVRDGIAVDGAGEVIAPQAPPIAPYLFAELRGSRIVQLAEDTSAPILHISLNEAARPARTPGDFDSASLAGQVIAEPLGSRILCNPSAPEAVIIHLDVSVAVKAARDVVLKMLADVKALDPDQTSFKELGDVTHPYVFARLTGYATLALVDLDRAPPPRPRAIYRIWEDATVRAFITDSIATVKADAAQIAFSADGKNITWAVLDTGIDEGHPHFADLGNLDLSNKPPLAHMDFRPSAKDHSGAVADVNGHGTHVAGIIAGRMSSGPRGEPVAVVTTRNEAGAEEKHTKKLGTVAGMAPRCAIVSMRVLEDDSTGVVSSLISAIDQIQQWNDHGRNFVIHGVNLSLGYPFEAEWFACGQSPLCIEIDRLVQSGVVVVVAAGNSGYGYLQTEYTGAVSQGIGMSINDPGNADYAITVGATHRTEPHRYGVSYFSSKGPTGDGRLKPDLLAPGERIISCASAQSRSPQTVVEKDAAAPTTVDPNAYTYKEDSGTSMAAPHVSGIIAGFLSIRREYIGRPTEVKSILMRSATDLGRDRNFQGAGLVDLMRAIQSV